jgi:hypothetical protein
MTDPCEIAESKTVPGDYVLLKKDVETESGITLRVPVRIDGSGTNLVTTAYYADATSHGKVIWKRGDD